jgi:hypothetical protein
MFSKAIRNYISKSSFYGLENERRRRFVEIHCKPLLNVPSIEERVRILKSVKLWMNCSEIEHKPKNLNEKVIRALKELDLLNDSLDRDQKRSAFPQQIQEFSRI